MQCYGLSQSGGIVLDGEVLERDARALNAQREGAEGTYLLAAVCGFELQGYGARPGSHGHRHGDVGMVVPGDDGLVAVLTAELDVGEPLRDDEFLLIRTFLNIDDLMVLHKGAADLNGLTDVSELSRAVAADDEGVGVVILRPYRAK